MNLQEKTKQNITYFLLAFFIVGITFAIIQAMKIFNRPSEYMIAKNGRITNYENVIAYVIRDEEIINTDDYEGERKIIDTGYLVAMDGTCKIDVVVIKGIKNIIFGGEGLFNTVVTGPGKVYIQSMPIEKTATKIYYSMPGKVSQPSTDTPSSSSSSE